MLEEQKYLIISDISEELPYEYDIATDTITFAEKFNHIFEGESVIENPTENMLKMGLVSYDTQSAIEELFYLAKAGTEYHSTEFKLNTKNGGFQWYFSTFSTIYDEEGTPLRVVGLLRNIHAQKVEQQKLLIRAETDQMTGLYNKATTESKIQASLRELNGNSYQVLISPDFITQMLGYCQRKDVGIVGARLYFEDGTIQHAGVIVGIGGIAGHAFSAMDEQAGIYQLRTSVACDYSAVTAACLMISRETFDAVGGLDPEFQVAFNDVDFCLKVRKLGKLVVYVPQAKLYHYESKSRGKEDTVKKQKRFHSEMQLFQSRWVDILATGDPYYNMNLALDAFDFSVRK